MNHQTATPQLARRMEIVRPSAIRELLKLGADPSIISFGGGYPDATIFPCEALNEAFKLALLEQGQFSLQYTVSNGIPGLREQLAVRMKRENIGCTAENILILQGGQQGLDLVAKLFIDRGDVIVTENPTFLGAIIAFNPCEPSYATVPMDENGMDMDALEKVLKTTRRVKFVYTVPDFQNPTGVTMSLPRRKRLIELANRFGVFILEDTPYREIRYQGEHVPTLKSLDTEGRVIYVGSFSKTLAPGLRLGWAVATEDIIQKLALLKLAADTQCSTLNMSAVSILLDRFDLDHHIEAIRATYLRKKNLMLDTIRQTFPQDVQFTEPSGGLFTWATFPVGFDAAKFMRERSLPEARVAYVPGGTFFAVEQETNHARMSYSTQPDEAIVDGITRLGRLLKTQFARAQAP